jgi:hypothetical protein
MYTIFARKELDVILVPVYGHEELQVFHATAFILVFM